MSKIPKFFKFNARLMKSFLVSKKKLKNLLSDSLLCRHSFFHTTYIVALNFFMILIIEFFKKKITLFHCHLSEAGSGAIAI